MNINELFNVVLKVRAELRSLKTDVEALQVVSGTSPASETVAGVLEIATQAETDAGTDNVRAVSPLRLNTRLLAFAQPLSENLTSLASTVSGTFGRTLLTSATAAAAKTSLTLVKADVGLANVDNTADTAKPVSTAQQTALNLKADTTALPTKSSLGLGNVDNTSDVNKPVSTAQQTALNLKADTTALPTKSSLGLGNVDNTSDVNKPVSTAQQTALNLKADTTALPTKSSLGLANVDNTSDANKPVSTAQQAALDLKANLSALTKANVGLGNVDNTSDVNKPVSTAQQAALNALPLYVQSRGVQLVTNGTGLLGNNQNFSSFTFNASDRPPGASGSFWTSSYQQARFNDELIPVNPENTAILDACVRQRVAGILSKTYIGVAGFDIDGQSINAQHHMYKANTLTTLASPLNPGDTTVTLTSSIDWENGGTAGVNEHLRSIIFWDYVDSKGYAYPSLTYSRNAYLGLWNPGAISSNVITLKTAWAGPTKAAGTPLSNGGSGGTYKYIAAADAIPTSEWTRYRGSISGIDTTGTNVTNKYAPGTAYVKVLLLVNYEVNGGEQAFSRISLTEISLTKSDVGLGNVDNTSDANKPVSTAQQTALNLKANLASPALTGVPTAPTAASSTNTTQVATTAFVQAVAFESTGVLPPEIDGGAP